MAMPCHFAVSENAVRQRRLPRLRGNCIDGLNEYVTLSPQHRRPQSARPCPRIFSAKATKAWKWHNHVGMRLLLRENARSPAGRCRRVMTYGALPVWWGQNRTSINLDGLGSCSL